MRYIHKITIKDERYPERLRQIKNPPNQLYFEGNIDLLNRNIIAIIGSRNCTEKGKKLAKKFAKELSQQELVIASGMARGIDSIAHEATIESKGKTIAILANGLNQIFPKENIGLYNKIIKQGGLVISEYQPDIKAESKYFLQRNRIVSGISIGILVIEATYRSGTSVTARLAKSQNRKVFVLPHEIDDKHGVGTNRLIKNGAILTTSTKEIINEFEFLTYKNIEIKQEKEKKKQMKKEYKGIYKLIEEKEIGVDEICIRTNKTIKEINQIVLMLEIEGYIQKVAGRYKCT